MHKEITGNLDVVEHIAVPPQDEWRVSELDGQKLAPLAVYIREMVNGGWSVVTVNVLQVHTGSVGGMNGL